MTTPQQARSASQRKSSRSAPSSCDSEQWQKRAAALVDWAEGNLWVPAGRPGLDYLRGRGLTNDTIRAARLGYNPHDSYRDPGPWGLEGQGKKVYIPAGVVIPCGVGGNWRYIRVRRIDGRPIRYEDVTGGGHGLYWADRMRGRPDVFVTHWELDCLLLWQVIQDLADVVTLGSADAKLDPVDQPLLSAGRRFYIATGGDPDGERNGAYWLDLVGDRGRRAQPVQGKDIGAAWGIGVDLRAWAVEVMAAAIPASSPSAATGAPIAERSDVIRRTARASTPDPAMLEHDPGLVASPGMAMQAPIDERGDSCRQLVRTGASGMAMVDRSGPDLVALPTVVVQSPIIIGGDVVEIVTRDDVPGAITEGGDANRSDSPKVARVATIKISKGQILVGRGGELYEVSSIRSGAKWCTLCEVATGKQQPVSAREIEMMLAIGSLTIQPRGAAAEDPAS